MCQYGNEWCGGWRDFDKYGFQNPCVRCVHAMRKEVDRLNELCGSHADTISHQGEELCRLQMILSNRNDKIEELSAKLEIAIDGQGDVEDEDPGYEVRQLQDHIHGLTQIIHYFADVHSRTHAQKT